jgi:hypothetical protein
MRGTLHRVVHWWGLRSRRQRLLSLFHIITHLFIFVSKKSSLRQSGCGFIPALKERGLLRDFVKEAAEGVGKVRTECGRLSRHDGRLSPLLKVLRQPLEDRRVTISHAAMTLTFPASFMLAAAMNP